jgi:hypothetical protein
MKGIRPGKPDKPIPPKGSLLTVLWQVEMAQDRNGKRYSQWKCQCKCGRVVVVRRIRIQDGHTRSCGCLHSKAAKKNILIALSVRKRRSLTNA